MTEQDRINLLDMFKDHYWGSLEKDRELIIQHVEAVLKMVETE